jgi:hypothetical protein
MLIFLSIAGYSTASATVDEGESVTVTVYLRDPGAGAEASAGGGSISREKWVSAHGESNALMTPNELSLAASNGRTAP